MKYNFKEFLGRFIDNVEDLEFFKVTNNLPSVGVDGPWIGGGSIRRTLSGDKIDSDFDFFFKNEEQRKVFEEDLKSRGFDILSSNDHCSTFTGRINDEKVKVQSIHFTYYESPDAVIDSFDFTITQFAFDGTTMYCGEFALWDLARKRLALHKMTYAVSTLRRLIKYTNQGFTACGGVLASLLESVISDPTTVNREVQYVD